MWLAALCLVPLLAVLEIRADRAGRTRRVYLLKPLTTGCILLVALLAPSPVSRAYQAAIGAGLLCALAGDVFLMLPAKYFSRGLVSFLLAHLCYSVAFVSLAGPPRSPLAILAAIAFVAYLPRRLWPRLGRYRGPVLGYAFVLAFMAAAAHQQALAAGTLRAWLTLAGALLFVLSDTVLALDRFEEGRKRRQVLVLATYFAGQWLIAASVTRF